MPDILIRGMEMPKSCDECRLFNESWCMALGVENWRKSYNKPPEGGRLPDCPLVPLPEGHGRLGDLETAEAILHNKTFDLAGKSAEYNALNWALRQIKALPTIVPAEGDVNDGA